MKKIRLIVLVLIISGLSAISFSGCSDKSKQYFREIQQAFDKLGELNAIDMTMAVDIYARNNQTEAESSASMLANLKVISNETNELGYYCIEKYEDGQFVTSEESYYVNGWAYYDDGYTPWAEYVAFSDVDNMDTDVHSLINMTEINKLKPTISHNRNKYMVSLTDVPLDKIIINTYGLQMSTGNYIMNVWLDSKGMLKKFDYTASFTIEYIYFEVQMQFEVVAINMAVNINIPTEVLQEIEYFKDKYYVFLEDERYTYILAKTFCAQIIVCDKETQDIIFRDGFTSAREAVDIDVTDGIITLEFEDGGFVNYIIDREFLRYHDRDEKYLYDAVDSAYVGESKFTIYNSDTYEIIYQSLASVEKVYVTDGMVTKVTNIWDGIDRGFEDFFVHRTIESDGLIYTLDRFTRELIIYNKATSAQVYYEKFEINPTCIDVADGIVAIGFGNGYMATSDTTILEKSFIYYDKNNNWAKKTVTATTGYKVDKLFIYNNKIYHANQGNFQSSHFMVYDIITQTWLTQEYFLLSVSYNTIALNYEGGMLYVGDRSGYLVYICLETDTIVSYNQYPLNQDGTWTASRVTFDDEYVYYAGYRFDKLNGTIIGFAHDENVFYDAMDDEYLYAFDKGNCRFIIYCKESLQVVYFEQYPNNTRITQISVDNGIVSVDIEKGRLEKYKNVNGDFVNFVEDAKYLYTINRATASFVVYSKDTMEIVYRDEFESTPYVIDVADDIVAIGFGHGAYDYDYAYDHLGKRLVYYSNEDWTKNTVATSDPVDHVFVYNNKIYYSKQDQWNWLYIYDVSNKTVIDHVWGPNGFSSHSTYHINREDGILYVGGRGSSWNSLFYICLETDTKIFENSTNLGSYTLTRVTFDGEYVYYAGLKFDKLTGEIAEIS